MQAQGLEVDRTGNPGSTNLNRWVLHNFSQRRDLVIAPMRPNVPLGQFDWNWDKATTFLDNGRVLFSDAVGIGTRNLNGSYKLFVKGGIVSDKIKVELCTTTGWCDYVFEPTYQLRPLSEVEAFIQQHKHLPEVPSAAEVAENGIDVAEMDATLLKKIEELTLYVIELEKKIKALEEDNKK